VLDFFYCCLKLFYFASLGTLRQPLGMDHSVDHLFMELVDTFELANDVGNLQASEVQVICIIALRV